MCGIAGIFSPGQGPPSEVLLRRMLSLIRHRGPDEFGIYRGPDIGLAHARLSIIDLATGRQPMSNEDESIWIAFNGEIFNYLEIRTDLVRRGHRFRTNSDTEVIIHLYEEKGIKALEDLNGQFAFALWDERKGELLLARDRIGIRPLYYTSYGNEWIFGSEIKAIFADGRISRRIDPVALDDIFTFWVPLSPRTAFEGIREVPPGHYLVAWKDGFHMGRYWSLREEVDPPGRHPDSYYHEGLRELLVDATRLRLRADVPVGAYLSGGLDSSVTATLIRRFSDAELCTFSVTFEDPEFDERAKQKIMEDFLNTRHRSISCGYDDIATNFMNVIWHAEVPILRTAPVPLFLLSRLVRNSSFKVILTGEGADEILAGYDIFKEDKVRRFMEGSPGSKWRPLLLHRLYPYLKNSPTRSLSYAQAFFGSPAGPYAELFRSHTPRWTMTSMVKSLFSDELRAQMEGDAPWDRISKFFGEEIRSPDLDPLTRAQMIEMKILLPGYILSTQGDRVAMAHAVEGRFPFLDHRVVEFCTRIPSRLRMRALTEKYILRKCMATHLPHEISKMVKQPYRAPDAKSFFHSNGGNIAEEMLSPDMVSSKGYFDPERVSNLVAKGRRAPYVGFKDNMAFIGVLSTHLVDELFIRKFDASAEISRKMIHICLSPKLDTLS